MQVDIFKTVKKYDCMVIDPPWAYSLRQNDSTHRNKINYSSMSVGEIIELPIKQIRSSNGSVLWLWFTNNHAASAIQCLQAWEYEIKTILTWEKVCNDGIKPRIGVGHWLRNCTEHCFLATNGKVSSFRHQKTMTNQSTILRAPRREHSRKPEEFFTLVNTLCPSSNKLELFARQERQGWDCWGNEVDKFTKSA